ncbi:MAG: hypothetical protein ACOVS5_18695, partial [Oligoflexus sp.]
QWTVIKDIATTARTVRVMDHVCQKSRVLKCLRASYPNPSEMVRLRHKCSTLEETVDKLLILHHDVTHLPSAVKLSNNANRIHRKPKRLEP